MRASRRTAGSGHALGDHQAHESGRAGRSPRSLRCGSSGMPSRPRAGEGRSDGRRCRASGSRRAGGSRFRRRPSPVGLRDRSPGSAGSRDSGRSRGWQLPGVPGCMHGDAMVGDPLAPRLLGRPRCLARRSPGRTKDSAVILPGFPVDALRGVIRWRRPVRAPSGEGPAAGLPDLVARSSDPMA